MIEARDEGRWLRIRYMRKKKVIETAGQIREVKPLSITISSHFSDGEGGHGVWEEIPRSCILAYGWAEIFKWWNE